jgi:CHAT domain-containing protein
VASLWSINDTATARLFEVFYQQLNQGYAPAVALQQASSILRQDEKFKHPYYWAAFQVNGVAF